MLKLVQTWAGERQVRAVTLKGSRGKLRFAWLAWQIPLSMTRTGGGLKGGPLQRREVKVSDYKRQAKMKKMKKSFELSGDLPDESMYRTEESKPKCPKKRSRRKQWC